MRNFSYALILFLSQGFASLAYGQVIQNESPSPQTPQKLFYRLGAQLSGGYTSNVYFNASQITDVRNTAAVQFDGKVLFSKELLLKWYYTGQYNHFYEEQAYRSFSNKGKLTLGGRFIPDLYGFIDAGVEQIHYNQQKELSFIGSYGTLGFRWEANDVHTIQLSYQFRYDLFQWYDLDNWSQLLDFIWGIYLSDNVELKLPLHGEFITYVERHLLDEDGNLLDDHRTTKRVLFSPALDLLLSYSLKLSVSITGELNNSTDAFFYIGPFGNVDFSVDPTMIRNFESYWALGSKVFMDWNIVSRLSLHAGLSGGKRNFIDRYAFDELGTITTDLEKDSWILPFLMLNWKVARNAMIGGHYSYLKQWSNDPLWDYNVHMIFVTLNVWLEN